MIYMSIFSELLKKEHRHQQFLIVVFILYLLMGHTTPAFIADFVDTPYGKVVVIAFFLVLFWVALALDIMIIASAEWVSVGRG